MAALSTVPSQPASSGDCSAIKVEGCNLSQAGATCMRHQPAAAAQSPAQHAQQVVSSHSSQQPPVQHQAAAPPTSRQLRKRKQPIFEGQQRALASTHAAVNAAVDRNVAATGDQSEPLSGLPHCKDKQPGSKPSGGQTEAASRKRRAKGKTSKFDAYVGRTIDVPAPIFGVDIPDLYYRGTVLKKDNAHAGCMVVRFSEDGSKYWFPLVEIQRFLKDMQNKGRDAESDTIGQGSHAFAAQVLAGSLVAKKKASGITSSSATTGSPEIEVSSCIHQDVYKPPVPTRFSKGTSAGDTDEGMSLLQTLAAAADSGDI
ncbi:hypothetical protein ABBQ32_008205 [Trebouxia sp. C0010 RCD-2024]